MMLAIPCWWHVLLVTIIPTVLVDAFSLSSPPSKSRATNTDIIQNYNVFYGATKRRGWGLQLQRFMPPTTCTPLTPISSALHMNWFTSSEQKTQSSSSKSSKSNKDGRKIAILDKIGSGSYGTVHYCKFSSPTAEEINDNGSDGDDSHTFYVAKRAWTFDELKRFQSKQKEEEELTSTPPSSSSNNADMKKQKQQEEKQLKERAKRCKHYLNVEEHCFQKINDTSEKKGDSSKTGGNSNTNGSNNEEESSLPNFVGRFKDEEQEHEWLVFDLVTSQVQNSKDNKNVSIDDVSSDDDMGTLSTMSHPKAAKTLNHAMFLDWKDQHKLGDVRHHHLYMIQKELGMTDDDNSINCVSTFEDTLDVIMGSLLKVLVEIHKRNIVHRDLKPDNLLLDGNSQVRANKLHAKNSITESGKVYFFLLLFLVLILYFIS